MENILLAPRRSFVARVIASSVVALMGISGLAVPANANGVDPVAPTSALVSADVVSGAGGNTLALTTGKSKVVAITSDPTLLSSEAVTVASTNADISIAESVNPVNGIATFTIVGGSATTKDDPTTPANEAEPAVVTFSATGRADLVVDVSVTDPKLKAALEANVSSLNIRVGSFKTATITSDDLGLPADAEVTAVSSDADLITVTDAVQPVSGSAAFRVEAVGITSGTETITFQSYNYEDVVVNVTTFDELKSTSFTEVGGVKTLNLVTGKSVTAQISSYLVLKTTEPVTVGSTNADISIQESVNPVNGTATFTIVGGSATTKDDPTTQNFNEAEPAVLTFSAAGRTDLVVNVTVSDPKLKAALEANVSSLNIRVGSYRTATITSDDLGLPADAEVTAVSSDADLITVTDAVTPVSGSAAFRVEAVGITSGTETITFQSYNYEDVVVNVTTFDDLKSTSFTDNQSGAKTLNLVTGVSASAEISAYLALKSTNEPVTVVSTVTGLTIQPSVNAANGIATFNISSNTAGSGTLTFSAAGRTSLVVYVTVIVPILASTDFVVAGNANSLSLKTGKSTTLQVSGSYTAVTVSSTNADIAIAESVNPVNGVATFTIVGGSATIKDDPTTTLVDEAEPAVVTFSATGRDDLVVNVAVTDPKLKSDALNLSMRKGSYRTVTITSDELGLPADAEITAVSSDADLISVTDAVTPVSGSAAFRVDAVGATSGTETITFQSFNYEDVVVNVEVFNGLSSIDLVSGANDSYSLALKTGKAATIRVTGAVTAVTSNSTNADITIEQSVEPVNGVATFNIVGGSATTKDDPETQANEAEPAVVTFSSGANPDLVVSVSVSDPKLKASLEANVTSLNIRVGSYRTATITSDDLGLPADAEVTAVSSDADLITVTDAVTPVSGSAAFRVEAVGITSGTETITFRSYNYEDVVVNVTTFDDLKSSSFTDNQSGAKTLNLVTGEPVTAQISAFLKLSNDEEVTAISTNDEVTIESSVNPVNGIATFNIVSDASGTAVLTFSADGRTNLVVYVTIAQGFVTFASGDEDRLTGISLGETNTVVINTTANVEVTGLSNDPSIASVVRVGTSRNTFRVTGVSLGTANISFAAPGAERIVIEAEVTKASLTTTEASYDLYSTRSVSFDVTSAEFPVGADTKLLYAIDGSEDPSVEVTIDETTVTVTGLVAGSAIVTISDEDAIYVPVSFDVTVSTPALATDSSSYEMFYGQSTVVTVASDEVELDASEMADILVEADESVVSLDNPATEDVVEGPVFVEGSGYEFVFYGLAAGSSEVKFSREGFADATVNVTVAAPALSAELDLSTIFIGDTTSLVISSDEQPISEENLALITAVGSNEEAVSVTPGDVDADNNSVALTIEGLAAGSSTITLSIPNYADVIVQITVATPALKTDVTSVRAFIGLPTVIEVSSDDKVLEGTVTASTTVGLAIGEDCTGENTGEGSPEGEITKVTLCGAAKGSYLVTLTAENYIPVTVRVIVVAPSLKSEVSKVEIFSGNTGEIQISSDEVALTSDMKVTASNTPGITFVNEDNGLDSDNEAFGSDEGIASFKFTASTPGAYRVNFNSTGFKQVGVLVVVVRPELVSDATSVSVNNGGVVEFTVSSSDVDLADTLVLSAEPKDEIGSVSVEPVSNGEAVVKFTAESIGKSTITVAAPNFKSVVVKVTVLPARLEVDVDSFTSVINGVTRVTITSPDSDAFDPTAIEGIAVKDGIAQVTLSEEDSESGKAVFDIKGLAKGSTRINFKSEGFATIPVSAKFNTAILSTNTSSVQLFAGQSLDEESRIVISSPDLALTEDLALEIAPAGSSIEVVTELTSYEEGQILVTIKGLAKGRDKLVVSGTGFKPVSIAVNVAEAALVTNVSAVAFRADGSATVKISSKDLPFSDEFDPTSITLEGGGGLEGLVTIGEVKDVTDGVAEITLVAPEVTDRLTGTFTLKAENYKGKSLKVTVTPTPVCVDKSLGQIKFGNDAKLSSAAQTSITKFAAELVDFKCVGTTLTSYVPAANTKANAAKYAKELQLASSREAAVSSALTAAIAKLRPSSEIKVTVVRGTVPTSVLNGSAAAQASYRRIDVAANSTIETARSFKLRRLI